MTIEKHDIVQIIPEHKWGGCFVVVTEVKNWGIQGYVEVPLSGRAYIRLKTEDFEKVGTAQFVLTEDYTRGVK